MGWWKKLKALAELKTLLNLITEGRMKELVKSVAGWIKIIGYVFAGASLVAGYLPVDKVVAFTIILSALVKISEIIAPLTKTTADDEIVAAIKKEGTEHGLLK